jgi:uncharacterized protein YbcC (UPF0753/DUF2309 family)
MSLSLGDKLKIRAMVYVAGEPIPLFWPMRSFIHHNPLHGLEHLPFEDAVAFGRNLFHGEGYLPRSTYQRYLVEGRVDPDSLHRDISAFLATQPHIDGIDLQRWLELLLTEYQQTIIPARAITRVTDIEAALRGRPPSIEASIPLDIIAGELRVALTGDRPVYEVLDVLTNTSISADLDELVIKSCLDFFDEGQSVWHMPEREKGFFQAWRAVSTTNAELFLRGLRIQDILAEADSPEGIIAHVMQTLQVPEKQWVSYFTRELSRLHGWAGYIRWRANARHYYWNIRFPGDLVDLMAVRLTLALALIKEQKPDHRFGNAVGIEQAIQDHPMETYLRHEFHSGNVLPAFAPRIEHALALKQPGRIASVFESYVKHQLDHQANTQAQALRALAEKACDSESLPQLSTQDLGDLISILREFEQREGIVWLRGMESHAMNYLVQGVNIKPQAERDKRPFAQAMFCIDTRSERIRRQLESVGDYQTFGIAGFFGVPMSFMELGKGSETHLCPVLLTPKNLVLEMSTTEEDDVHAVTALEKILHELKESIFSPFVTVEAIGLLFGFDMVGKTLMPCSYHRWRKHLHKPRPPTHLLLDKLNREQADSILRAAQRAVIEKAVELEFEVPAERVNDSMVRELREAAMGKQADAGEFQQAFQLDAAQTQAFVQRLRDTYRIDPACTRLQMERLGRFGFSLEEQVNFVSQALQAIGLTKNFSRFVLLVGHGSTSDNNPYESALDCGACGGNHGVANARALAQMANKPEVRRRLHEQGIEIDEDAWFVPALHNTTTDELRLFDLDRMPSSHVVYLDRLRNGLLSASRLCAQERLPSLQQETKSMEATAAYQDIQRNAVDWSQVRPEWGLARNAYFIIGRRDLTRQVSLQGRAFLHSYDYRLDPRCRLLENILTGPLVVGQWINMEHYFSTVDNEHYGSGSKVYHNVAGRFAVMTGNLSDLRTGLPAQTVLNHGQPYHEPLRLVTVIEAPLERARHAIDSVATVKQLVRNNWIRLMVIDPEKQAICIYDDGQWLESPLVQQPEQPITEESIVS